MPIIAKAGPTFTPAPAGVHQAVCVDVVDLGIIETKYQGQSKSQHKIRIVWEIDETMQDGKRFTVGKRYTLSLHEKAALRKDLESWRGRQFTEQELQGFDVEAVLDVNCMLNIVHESNNGSTYANISAIMPLHKGMQKLQPSGLYIRQKDRKPENGNGQEPPPPEADGHDITDEDVPF